MENAKILGDVFDDLARGLGQTPRKIKHFSEDNVNHPNHYKQYSQEVIDTIEEVTSQYLGAVGYSVGNAIKSIFRAPFKGNNVEDLKKSGMVFEQSD